jgi:carbon-monoxide dehydrogenase large subunit
MKLDTYAALTNTVPAGSYRGLGTPDAVFGIETLINELAEDLGVSPVEIRLKNMLTKGEYNDYGERVVATGVAGCLKAVAEAIDVDGKPEQDDPVWIKGRGIACAGKQNSPSDAGRAEVWLHSDGSVEALFSSDNQGMGASTVMAQIVAEELKTDISNIKCTISDTARTPYDNQSSSSRAVYLTGNAVKRACEDLIRKVQTEAGRKLNLAPELVRVAGDKLHITGAVTETLPITELFSPFTYFEQNLYGPRKGTPIKGYGIFAPPPIIQWDENGRTPKMWNWYQYAAAAVEIAVNIKTGQIKVLRLASAADTGNPLNPKIVEQQIEGGAHMSIGFFLNEEHLYDKNGAIWNSAFNDYRLPMVFEMPKNDGVISLICPDPQPDGPYGAKGMSESVTCAIGPAISGALYRMFGIRIRSFPMTAERILAALEAAGKADV